MRKTMSQEEVRNYGRLGLGKELSMGAGRYDDNAWIFVVHTGVTTQQLAELDEESAETYIEACITEFSDSLRSLLQNLRFGGQVQGDIDSL